MQAQQQHDQPSPKGMSNVQRLRYAMLCLRGWKHCLWYPIFTIRLTVRRLALTITRQFCGPTIVSPVTGEAIFNVHSLFTYWAIHVVRELGDEWHPILRDAVRPVVFDVGANVGIFGRLVRSINPASYIVAVDPWQEMEAHNSHAAKFHPVALGGTPGIVQLTRTKGMTASTAPGYYQGESWQVQVVKLDDLWREHGSPDVAVLKIDVDGAEAEVLAGAQAMLAHTKCIILEVNSPEVLAALPAGFSWKTHNWHDRIGLRVQSG